MKWRGIGKSWFPRIQFTLTAAFVLAAAGSALAQADSGGATSASDGSANFFVHFLRSVGWTFGAIFMALSISLLALIALLSMDLRLQTSIPPKFVEEFSDTVNKRKFKEAFELARGDPSFLGRVMASGMSRLQYGIDDARDAAFNTVSAIKSSKDQLINYVAVISSLGPYIGLVGTVYGMILAFMELSRPGASPNPQKLADGISHALVVTMVGIGLAVPGLFFTVFFRNRATRIAMETENLADDLLTQMYHNSKKAAASASPNTDDRPVAPQKVAE